MATVHRWSGKEIRALRDAKRMSLREFAAHLGVSERMISKWEAGGENTHPRPVNQAALDTCLARCDPDTRARFSFLTGDSLVLGADADAPPEPIGSSPVRHPRDGNLMTKVEGSVFLSGPSNEPIWVPDYYIDIHPVSNAAYARFIAATGHTPPQHWTDGQYPDHLAEHPRRLRDLERRPGLRRLGRKDPANQPRMGESRPRHRRRRWSRSRTRRRPCPTRTAPPPSR